MNAAVSSQTTIDLLQACVQHLGAAVLAIWGVDENGHCRCPKGTDCGAPGKHPNARLCPNGFKNATRDISIIRQWVRQAPKGNWAIRCGEPMPGGGFLGAFDWDPRNGSAESLDQIAAQGHELPDSVLQNSGGGGGHLLWRFKHSPASRSVAPGIDLQGDGKYIVVAPSRHHSKGTYSWELGQGPGEITVADAPEWLAEETDEAVPRPAPDTGTARDTVLGEAFTLANMAGPVMLDGSMFVRCPQAHQHSDSRGRGEDASTVVLPPAGGSKFGGFKCLHGHCANLKWADVLKTFSPEIVEAANRKFPRLAVVTDAVETTPDSARDEVPAEPGDVELKEVRRRFAYKSVKGVAVLKNDIINLNVVLTYDPRWKDILKFDSFSQVLRFTRQPPWHPDDAGSGSGDSWSDADTTRMDLWLRRSWGIELDGNKIREGVYVVGHRDTTNPLHDYLNGLKWDGAPRLDAWLTTYAGVRDTAYSRIAGRKWMLSAVARALRPGCKVDTCLILEGPQGKGKSTLFRVLATGSADEGNEASWFSDTAIDIGSKDAYVAMRGKWIIELAELASLRKADLDRTKAFFSSPVDSYRPPYGREQVTIPRTAVFCGTVNHGQYLHDATGARRFWPCTIGVMDIPQLIEDRDQLWAEAVARYKEWVERGSKVSECLWWPSHEEMDLFEKEQTERQVGNPWTEAIALWCESGACKNILRAQGHLLVRDIADGALKMGDKDVSQDDMSEIGVVMVRELKWTKKKVNVAGAKAWGYAPK